jgi:MOSC domain-containing protein YiiM
MKTNRIIVVTKIEGCALLIKLLGGKPMISTGTNKPVLVSIQVGMPHQLGKEGSPDPMDRAWSTGFFKEPVKGRSWLGKTNLDGDGQADLKHHGGPEKAVLAYSEGHYLTWRNELNFPNLPYGAFGENLTIAGSREHSVCIGDTYAIGEVLVQVSQPRVPCWKIARRWRIEGLDIRVKETGRTGWYLRVLKEGYLEANQTLTLIDRPFPEWNIDRANDIIHRRNTDPDAIAQLASCELLASNWREILISRLEKGGVI